jgi:hypothetical protein
MPADSDEPRTTRLPEELVRLLDGSDLEHKIGHTVLAVVGDPAGWPHVALLSAGEVLITAPDQVGLALYAGSRTSRLLRTQRRVLLFTVVERRVHKIQVSVHHVAKPGPDGHLVCFLGRIADVRVDEVAYATVTDGVRYVIEQPEDVLPRWQATLDLLAGLTAQARD